MPLCFRFLRGPSRRHSSEAGGIQGMSVQIMSRPLPPAEVRRFMDKAQGNDIEAAFFKGCRSVQC
jgi:hypothetical protein